MPLFHVWFATKGRRWLLQGDVAETVERQLWQVARTDGINVVELKAVIDHVHLLLELDSAAALPGAMKALKGKSARFVFLEMPDLKIDAPTHHLWQRGYGWKLVPAGAERSVRQYIRTQLDRLEAFDR
jgi:putative transposase